MDEKSLAIRKHPAHLPVDERFNRSNIVFVTVCTHQRKPVLANALMQKHIVEAFNMAEHFMVGRYVIMPDHIHFFCAPNRHPPESLKKWLSFWKSQVTRRCDNTITKPIWQREFWDRQLRSGESYSEKWAYVRQNPVRAALVKSADEWPFQRELNQLTWHD